MPATPVYPAQIDNAITLPVVIDLVTPVTGSVVNILRTAIIQIEMTLGVQPASTYGTVRARLDALEVGEVFFAGDLSGSSSSQTVIGLQNIPISTTHPSTNQVLQYNGTTWGPTSLLPGFIAGGDLSGTSINQTVIGLQAVPISATLPTTNQILQYTGTAWAPASAPITFTAGGDLSGSNTSQTVIGIHGIPVSSTAPTTGQVLEYNGTQYIPTSITATLAGDVIGPIGANTVTGLYDNPLASTSPVASAVPVWDVSLSHYDIRALTNDDIQPGFTINSFTGGSTVEIGATVTNPTFTASYSHTPNSAQITNTDGIDSPLVLSSPYTSGTVVGSFDHNSQATVTFTLTAIYTSTKTATSPINWYPRSFAGVGAPGATSTVTAHAGNTAQLSTGDILANEGLFSSFVGQSASFTASGQNLYFLLVGGSHTFTDNSNNLPFPFNTPTPVSFVNQNSQTISMYLYQSSTTLTGTYSIKVSS
jgi:hypothetical protein